MSTPVLLGVDLGADSYGLSFYSIVSVVVLNQHLSPSIFPSHCENNKESKEIVQQ